MLGVCSHLSSQRYADHERTVGCAKAPRNPSMEHGRGNRDSVSGRGRLREGHRSVEHESPETDISRASAKCEHAGTSRSWPAVIAAKKTSHRIHRTFSYRPAGRLGEGAVNP